MSRIGLLSIVFISGLFLFSCQENEPVAFASLEEMSSEAKNFFGMRSSSAKSMEATGNSMVNRSFQTTMRGSLGSSNGFVTGESKDSTIVSDPFPWVSCAVTTQIENSDGSTTYTTDYGDGCYEGYGDYKYFMRGKYWYNWKYQESKQGAIHYYSYFSRSRTENYGGEYYFEGDTVKWISNGRSTYFGDSKYDTVKQTFSGYYAYSDTSEHVYDGMLYKYKSVGRTSYDDKKSVTNPNVYEYTTGKEFYRSTVLSPLVSDYTCAQVYPMIADDSRRMWYPSYVSGRERIEYERDGQAGKFEIDYGDGECDFIVFIYENGKVFRVDMSKDYAIFTKG